MLDLSLKKAAASLICISMLFASSCVKMPVQHDYGVFLNVNEDIDQLKDYKTVVIDAQFFSAEEISDFKASGHEVFSYINIGSLENWRDYYDEDLTLCAYENWEEERWVDVSREEWQELVINELIPELLDKDIDGFFVDNCDVYYLYPTEEIMDGITVMLEAMTDTGKKVVINGGDTYLDSYCSSGGEWSDVITGINQESVFSAILWDEGKFGTADAEDNEYFKDYIERYADKGADIYLLEYTEDEDLIKEIDAYCKDKGFTYYVSDSLELSFG